MTTKMIPAHTVEALCQAYADAQKDMAQGYRLLRRSEKRLAQFINYPNVFPERERMSLYDGDTGEPAGKTIEAATKRMRSDMWRYVLQQTRVFEMCSEKQRKDFDKQLADGTLPELTVPNVYKLVENLGDNLPRMFAEAVVETFRWLKPGFKWDNYKTNAGHELGRKVIRSYVMESCYRGGMRVMYGREQSVQAMDNVFHMLDGKGVSRYPGNLLTAMKQAGEVDKVNECETEYFRCKWFKNGNLHIEFTRQDLVDELNRRAGDGSLKSGDDQPACPLAKTA